MFTTTFDTNKDRNFQKLEQIYQIWVNLGQFSIFRSPQRPKNESEGNFLSFHPRKVICFRPSGDFWLLISYKIDIMGEKLIFPFKWS